MMRPFLLGLTGSIGMGKTTTAGFLAACGVPVWDADAAVHRLYGTDAPGAAAIAALVPQAVTADGVDRAMLRQAIEADPTLLGRVERAIHPLVAADRSRFIERHKDAPLVVLDIPLLYETGAERVVDAVAVVTAAPSVQRARVLARPGMDERTFRRILSRQLPDREKRRRADFLIDTGKGLDHARDQVLTIMKAIGERRHA